MSARGRSLHRRLMAQGDQPEIRWSGGGDATPATVEQAVEKFTQSEQFQQMSAEDQRRWRAKAESTARRAVSEGRDPITGKKVAPPGAAPPGKPPTARQRAVIDVIAKSISARGYPPTVREIGKALGMRSPNAVQQHIDALRKKGLLRRPSRLEHRVSVPEAFDPTTAPDSPWKVTPRCEPKLTTTASERIFPCAEALEKAGRLEPGAAGWNTLMAQSAALICVGQATQAVDLAANGQCGKAERAFKQTEGPFTYLRKLGLL